MGVIISILILSIMFSAILIVLFKYAKLQLKYQARTSEAIRLLELSREGETLPTKRDRALAAVEWKVKRDSLLFKVESLKTSLSESD